MNREIINRVLGKEKLDEVLNYCNVIKEHSTKNEVEVLEIKNRIKNLEQKLQNIDQYFSEQEKQYLSNEYICLPLKNKTKKRILICGFYGAQNVGDELMLESILNIIKNKNLDITILLSNNYNLDSSFYAPYDVIHYPKSSSDILKLSKSFDIIIWGGGALLDDFEYKWRGKDTSISYILMAISIATIKNGGKVNVLGVSTNKEFEDTQFINDLNYLVQNSNYFSVRDKLSKQTIVNAKINSKRIEIIDDLSLLLDIKPQKNKTQKEKTKIGLIYVYSEEKYNKLENATKETLTELLKKNKNIEIDLIPFYSYNDTDKYYCNRLKESLRNTCKNTTINVKDYPVTSKQIRELMQEEDVIVTMRYHAALLSAAYGLKTVLIDLSNKHRHYFNKNKAIREKYKDILVIENSLNNTIIQKILTYIMSINPTNTVGKNVKNSVQYIENVISTISGASNESQ